MTIVMGRIRGKTRGGKEILSNCLKFIQYQKFFIVIYMKTRTKEIYTISNDSFVIDTQIVYYYVSLIQRI